MTENKHYKEPEYRPAFEEEDSEIQIDWMGILRQIIAIRKKLYKAAGVGLVIGIIIALSIPKQYTVSVTLSPEMGSSKSGSGIASMAASFLGGSIGNDSPDALNASLAPDIVASTPFLLELMKSNVITKDKSIETTLCDYLDKQKIPWWKHIQKIPNELIIYVKSFFSKKQKDIQSQITSGVIELSEKDYTKLTNLRNIINIDVDKKTAITTLTVSLQDPKVVAIVADSVVSKLQEYITTYRTTKAKEDCKYLEILYKERQQEYYKAQQIYANYVDANSNVVFQSTIAEKERLQNEMNLAYQVYSQVAQQLQMARAKVQEEKTIFAVVEPAIVPLQPSGASKKIYISSFILLSISCTIIWELLISKRYKQLKQHFQK